MVDYYQIFLITMTGSDLFFYIQHAGNQQKETNGHSLL